MHIGLIGLNFKTSDLKRREQLSFAIERLKYESAFLGTILLKTCNRVEIYFSSHCLAQKHSEILKEIFNCVGNECSHEFYTYFSLECFLHLSKVVSGIDSAIFGESEIQRQVKISYEEAKNRFDISKDLHFLFQKSLRIGKKIRTLGIEQMNRGSFEQTLYQMIRKKRGSQTSRLLFLGNSQINRKILFYLKNKNAFQMTVCSHTPVENEHIRYLPRSSFKSISEFDIVICAAKQLPYVIDHSHLEGLHHSVLIFDLGVPRNVHPAIIENPHIHLIGIDKLHKTIQEEQAVSYLLQKRFLQEVESNARHQYTIFQTKTTPLYQTCTSKHCHLLNI